MKHCNTGVIHTPRLTLRPFTLADAEDAFANWASDPDVQTEYGEPVYPSKEAVIDLLSRWAGQYQTPGFYRWAIIEKESGQNIGLIAFCRVYEDCKTAEIEYCIGRAFWGHGYAGEALSAVIEWTFRATDFEKLEAYHREANPKSGRVLEKSMMRRADTVERFRRLGQQPHGEVCYVLTRNAFLRSPGL